MNNASTQILYGGPDLSPVCYLVSSIPRHSTLRTIQTQPTFGRQPDLENNIVFLTPMNHVQPLPLDR